MSSYTSLFITRQKDLELYYKVQYEPSNKELETFLEDFCLNEHYYNCGVYDYLSEKDNGHEIQSMVECELEKRKQKEEVEPFTFSFLKRKLGWNLFCELTGTNVYCINEGSEINDSEIFYLKKSDVEKYGL